MSWWDTSGLRTSYGAVVLETQVWDRAQCGVAPGHKGLQRVCPVFLGTVDNKGGSPWVFWTQTLLWVFRTQTGTAGMGLGRGMSNKFFALGKTSLHPEICVWDQFTHEICVKGREREGGVSLMCAGEAKT